jgi:cell fate regulator YaaT (PSP1 superfamily)
MTDFDGPSGEAANAPDAQNTEPASPTPPQDITSPTTREPQERNEAPAPESQEPGDDIQDTCVETGAAEADEPETGAAEADEPETGAAEADEPETGAAEADKSETGAKDSTPPQDHRKKSKTVEREYRPGRKQSTSRSKPQAEPTGPTVVVRYGLMRQIGEFRHTLKTQPVPGQKVVVRTERGVELGEVIAAVHRDDTLPPGPRVLPGEKLQQFIKTAGSTYPFRRNGRVLRTANQQDLIDFRHLQSSATQAGKYCRQKIREKKLAMRVVSVEHMLGGERLVFYFTSESRVDFRELVRDLAGQYRTRIEMQQVGARDEARLVGDYERCGQQCCCREFLKDLKPVSMRMAKVQKATLDPSKISGRCGRLMCCLRYEDVTYSELRKKLPRKNSWVRTAEGVGKVMDSQIITQLVRLALPDNTYAVVPIDDIIERDVEPPTEEQTKQDRPARTTTFKKTAAAPLPPQQPEDESLEEAIDTLESEQKKPDKTKGERPGRQKRKPAASTQQPPQAAEPTDQKQDDKAPSSDKHASKKKRRRRKKRKRHH